MLTHLASGDWSAIEQAIAAILGPRACSKRLSNVARTILELICDDRGATGRIMRPFFFNAIERIAGEPEMKRLEKQVEGLRHRMTLGVQVRSIHQRRAKKSTGAHLARQTHFNACAAIPGIAHDSNGARL
jgi:hypothetical protein